MTEFAPGASIVCRKTMSLSRLLSRTVPLSRSAWSSRILPARSLRAPYSAAAGLPREAIERRILDVLKGFEKVDQSKVVTLSKPVLVSDLISSPFRPRFPKTLAWTA